MESEKHGGQSEESISFFANKLLFNVKLLHSHDTVLVEQNKLLQLVVKTRLFLCRSI